MFTCKIENEYGEQLELTNNKRYTVYKIDGLEPPTAAINTSKIANYDGSRFNSSRVNERNIVIYLAIEGDCETNRINLYKYARSKRYIKFYYKNGARDVYAEGYVESMPIGFFEMKQMVQISILCPNPYFKSVTDNIIELATIKPLFVFPFAYTEAGNAFSYMETEGAGETRIILNEGDIENGVIVQFRALGTVLNPVIYNFSTNEFYKIDVEMSIGDEITLNTNRSKKRIELTHDGITTNIINKMRRGSTWFQLLTGDNIFSYDADEFSENLTCTIVHSNEFEGV